MSKLLRILDDTEITSSQMGKVIKVDLTITKKPIGAFGFITEALVRFVSEPFLTISDTNLKERYSLTESQSKWLDRSRTLGKGAYSVGIVLGIIGLLRTITSNSSN